MLPWALACAALLQVASATSAPRVVTVGISWPEGPPGLDSANGTELFGGSSALCPQCEDAAEGFRLWEQRVNSLRSQGLTDLLIQFRVLFDGFNKGIALENYDALADEVDILLGPWFQPWHRDVSDLAEAKGVPLFLWASEPSLYEMDPFGPSCVRDTSQQQDVAYQTYTGWANSMNALVNSTYTFDVNAPEDQMLQNLAPFVGTKPQDTWVFVWLRGTAWESEAQEVCQGYIEAAQREGLPNVKAFPIRMHEYLAEDVRVVRAAIQVHMSLHGGRGSLVVCSGMSKRQTERDVAVLSQALRALAVQAKDVIVHRPLGAELYRTAGHMRVPWPSDLEGVSANHADFYQGQVPCFAQRQALAVADVVGALLTGNQAPDPSVALAVAEAAASLPPVATYLGSVSFSGSSWRRVNFRTGWRTLSAGGLLNYVPAPPSGEASNASSSPASVFAYERAPLELQVPSDSALEHNVCSTSKDHEQCEVWWEWSMKPTVFCVAGCAFAEGACQECPRGRYRGQVGKICIPCEEGSYADITGMTSCLELSSHAQLAGGNASLPPVPQPGFFCINCEDELSSGWYSNSREVDRCSSDPLALEMPEVSPPALQMVPCLPMGICKGGAQGNAGCVGSNAERLCNQCVAGDTWHGLKPGGRTCGKCPSPRSVYLSTIIIFVLGGLLCMHFARLGYRASNKPSSLGCTMHRSLLHYAFMLASVVDLAQLDSSMGDLASYLLYPVNILHRPLLTIQLECTQEFEEGELGLIVSMEKAEQRMWRHWYNSVFLLPTGCCIVFALHLMPFIYRKVRYVVRFIISIVQVCRKPEKKGKAVFFRLDVEGLRFTNLVAGSCIEDLELKLMDIVARGAGNRIRPSDVTVNMMPASMVLSIDILVPDTEDPLRLRSLIMKGSVQSDFNDALNANGILRKLAVFPIQVLSWTDLGVTAEAGGRRPSVVSLNALVPWIGEGAHMKVVYEAEVSGFDFTSIMESQGSKEVLEKTIKRFLVHRVPWQLPSSSIVLNINPGFTSLKLTVMAAGKGRAEQTASALRLNLDDIISETADYLQSDMWETLTGPIKLTTVEQPATTASKTFGEMVAEGFRSFRAKFRAALPGFVYTVLVFNVSTVAFEMLWQYGSDGDHKSPEWLFWANLVCVCVYIFEAAYLMASLGCKYWRSIFNVIDFALILLDIVFLVLLSVMDTAPPLPIFRLLKFIKVLKVVKSLKMLKLLKVFLLVKVVILSLRAYTHRAKRARKNTVQAAVGTDEYSKFFGSGLEYANVMEQINMWGHYRSLIRQFVVWIVISYPAVLRGLATPFMCDTIYVDGRVGWHGLHHNLNLECSHDSRTIWTFKHAAEPIMYLYAFGVPLLVFITIRCTSLRRIKPRRKFAFLHVGYKDKFFYWEAVALLRSGLLVLCGVWGDSPFTRSMYMTLVFLGSIIVQVYVSPYESECRNALNIFEFLCLAALFVLVVLMGLGNPDFFNDNVLYSGTPLALLRSDYRGLTDSIAILVNLCALGYSLVAMLFHNAQHLEMIVQGGGYVNYQSWLGLMAQGIHHLVRRFHGLNMARYKSEGQIDGGSIDISSLNAAERNVLARSITGVFQACLESSDRFATWRAEGAIYEAFERAVNLGTQKMRKEYESHGVTTHAVSNLLRFVQISIPSPDSAKNQGAFVDALSLAMSGVRSDIMDHHPALSRPRSTLVTFTMSLMNVDWQELLSREEFLKLFSLSITRAVCHIAGAEIKRRDVTVDVSKEGTVLCTVRPASANLAGSIRAQLQFSQGWIFTNLPRYLRQAEALQVVFMGGNPLITYMSNVVIVANHEGIRAQSDSDKVMHKVATRRGSLDTRVDSPLKPQEDSPAKEAGGDGLHDADHPLMLMMIDTKEFRQQEGSESIGGLLAQLRTLEEKRNQLVYKRRGFRLKGASSCTSSLDGAALMEQDEHLQASRHELQAPLPAGWESALDPTHSRVYYFHRATGKTTWIKPEEKDGDAPLPSGWRRLWDTNYSREYYVNVSKNISTWTMPTIEDSAEEALAEPDDAEADSTDSSMFGGRGAVAAEAAAQKDTGTQDAGGGLGNFLEEDERQPPA